MHPLIPKTRPPSHHPPSFATLDPAALRVRPDESTKNYHGATKDANETTESPPVAMDSMRAATTMDSMRAEKNGGRQVLIRVATATKDMNNNTSKTAGQGGFMLLSLPNGADKLESTKKKTSSGLVQVRVVGRGRHGQSFLIP